MVSALAMMTIACSCLFYPTFSVITAHPSSMYGSFLYLILLSTMILLFGFIVGLIILLILISNLWLQQILVIKYVAP